MPAAVAGGVEADAAALQQELAQQRAMIAVLQETMLEMAHAQQTQLPVMPLLGAPQPSATAAAAAAARVPWEGPRSGGLAPAPNMSALPVPDGTKAGQVFLVNGQYYVAVPRHTQAPPPLPRPRTLPPLAAADSPMSAPRPFGSGGRM